MFPILLHHHLIFTLCSSFRDSRFVHIVYECVYEQTVCISVAVAIVCNESIYTSISISISMCLYMMVIVIEFFLYYMHTPLEYSVSSLPFSFLSLSLHRCLSFCFTLFIHSCNSHRNVTTLHSRKKQKL